MLMSEMLENGELLESLMKWKGQHCNLAISLKYFNRLMNIILNSETAEASWIDRAPES